MHAVSLATLAREQLSIARSASSSRSAFTLHGGHNSTLRQTLIALAAGHMLDDHMSPGEVTLQVLLGRVRVMTAAEEWEGSAGDYLTVPGVRHSVAAIDDCVLLLTVALKA